ncbi:hypothetical protein Barb6_00901 [Bacteroidales bacterium Barb6]|nr:hypothetical protein Barb6_00901 [Bacteroidales bacterium Barb6]
MPGCGKRSFQRIEKITGNGIEGTDFFRDVVVLFAVHFCRKGAVKRSKADIVAEGFPAFTIGRKFEFRVIRKGRTPIVKCP